MEPDRPNPSSCLPGCLPLCVQGGAGHPPCLPPPPSLPRWGPRQGCTLALERPSLADLPALLGDWGCSLRLFGLRFRCKLRGSQCRPEQRLGNRRGPTWEALAASCLYPLPPGLWGLLTQPRRDSPCPPTPRCTPAAAVHILSPPLCRACPPPSLSAVSGSPTPGTPSRQRPPPSTEGPGCSPKRPGFAVSPKTPRHAVCVFMGGAVTAVHPHQVPLGNLNGGNGRVWSCVRM